MNMECQKKHIMELCRIERAIRGKKYKKGTLMIKLSAVDETVDQLERAGEIESRYAALEPLDGVDPDYLYITVCRSFPDFLRKHRTTINLKLEELKHLTLDWHKSDEAQRFMVEMMKVMDRELEEEERLISRAQEVKRWYLVKMMV